MMIGLILGGSLVGALFGVTSLILGHSVWMALLIYSGVGALSVIIAAAVLALRADPEERIEPTGSHTLAPAQRS
jgi:hypothetical protein